VGAPISYDDGIELVGLGLRSTLNLLRELEGNLDLLVDHHSEVLGHCGGPVLLELLQLVPKMQHFVGSRSENVVYLLPHVRHVRVVLRLKNGVLVELLEQV